MKKSKGSVSVQSLQGRLRLQFRVNGNRHFLTLGYPDEPMYRRVAELKAREIEADILYDRFDPTLAKYKGNAGDEDHRQTSMRDLWAKYVEHRRPQVAPSTIKNQYGQVTRHVEKLPTDDPQNAIQIRDWALQSMTTDAAHRFIEQLCACCDWAVESGLSERNAFDGLAKKIKVPKGQRKSDDDDIDPFTAGERDLIIAAFRNSKYYRHYADMVEFLFKVGCRPSEALALQWKHIGRGFKTIRFEQGLTESENGLIIKQGLKTQERRSFPCNESMQKLLRSIHDEAQEKTGAVEPEALVFPAPRAKYISFHNFGDRGWQTILEELKIRYRKAYQTRHTFITLALQAGMSAQDVAKLCGNSPETVYKHYAGTSRKLEVPEF